jgi:hypothetical protein
MAATSTGNSLIGRVINGFQITHRIGGGNWGEVFAGYSPDGEKVENMLFESYLQCESITCM